MQPGQTEITRRAVVRSLAALAAGKALSLSGSSRATRRVSREGEWVEYGAQTNAWAIDPKRFDSFLDVLHQIHEIGYAGFETGFRNVMQQFQSPSEARRQIEKTGLTFFGTHIFLPGRLYDPSTNLPPAAVYEKVVPGAFSLGSKHLIFSGAPAQNMEQLQHKIAGLNAAGKFCNGIGLPLAYHNETAMESQSKFNELESIYSQTDPTLVSFLLDAGHAYQGGMDVPAFARKNFRRIVGLHLRDFKNGTQVRLGEGTFPLAQLAAVLKQAKWRGWVLNEEERLDGSKNGPKVMGPAFQAMRGAFSA